MSTSPTIPTPKKQTHHRWFQRAQLSLGIVISLAAIVWIVHSVEGEEVLNQLRSVEPWALVVAFFLTIFSYLLRSWRWPFFFEGRALSFQDSARCVFMGFFANNVLPARMGELVRAHLGGRALKVSRAVVLATVAGERLIDGVMISVIFAAFFMAGARPSEQSEGQSLFFVAYGFAAAAAGVIIVLLNRRLLFRVLDWFGHRSGKSGDYATKKLKHFIDGLEPMFRPSRLGILVLSSLAIWLVELLVYAMIARAFSADLSPAGVALFLAAVNFSSLIPAAPGGIGVIEAFATAALFHIGVGREVALAMVASQHLMQFVVVGVPGLFLFFFRFRGKMLATVEEEDDSLAGINDSEERATQEGNVSCTVVIPAFNEENRLLPTLESVVAFLRNRGESFEVLVVDDGSSDRTPQIVQEYARANTEVQLLSYASNRGKGYAVRYGVQRARGELILFDDADGATPIEEIERLARAIAQGADIAIGSRALLSQDTQVRALWYRKVAGRVFNRLANLLLVPGIQDTQCGFKLFRREVAQAIFARQRSDRFAFDVEVLFLARRLGFRVSEQPINWHEVPGSRINIVTDSMAMFAELLKFRLRALVGGYGRKPDPEERRNASSLM